MARLFGLIGNRADLAGRVLASEAETLRVRAKAETGKPGGPLGWGVGFYQGGEVLMRRRPIDDRPEIDVAKNAFDVRADVLIGQVRQATVGALRTENTHPFRYRQWLFAQTGTVSQFDGIKDRLQTSVPEFLRGGIRGETDAEIVFHVFLSFLHDAGRLHDMSIEEAVVRDALRSTLAVVDGMTAEIGGELGALNMIVTNGDFIVALHRSDAMAYRQFAGKSDADALIGDDQQLRRRAPELAQMRFVLLASDLDDLSSPDAATRARLDRWKKVSDRAIVTLTRAEEPKIEAL
jgi:predicted glutamine amidotransferase